MAANELESTNSRPAAKQPESAASRSPSSASPAPDTPAAASSDSPASDSPASDSPASDSPASDSPASDSAVDARTHYLSELETIGRQHAAHQQISRRLNYLRGGTFFVGLLLLLIGYFAAQGNAALVYPGWAALVAFLLVITWHENIRHRCDSLLRRQRLYRQLLARTDRQWDRLPVYELPADAPWAGDNDRAVAYDLDLFGAGSLYQLICLAATGPGKTTLARWLIGPAQAEQAMARNVAILKIAPLRSQRESFYATARDVSELTASPENFAAWAGAGPWLSGMRRFLIPLARLVAVTPLVIWPLAFFQVIPLIVAAGIQAGMLVLAVLITVGFLGPVHQIFGSVASRRADVQSYLELFQAAKWMPDDVPQLQSVRQCILDRQTGAITGLHAMASVTRMTNLQRQPLFFLAYIVLQLFGLWDLHALALMERWKRRFGAHVPAWFEALGEMEAIVSLAALADENPRWATPTWNPAGTSRVAAKEIAHPLLCDSDRVSNDVSVGPAGTLLLVTGSNMSGKSTMLRSLGLNIKLAGTGSVVCAQAMELPSCEVATSIRVQDSVRDGVSFYMAELKRLRKVVDHAAELSASGERQLVFLLDEILQGTNSRERQIAVATVLRHLVQMQAIGAISTHDLELADDEEIARMATVVHFREQIVRDDNGDETMHFDYKMRPGVTPTTNAIRLLEMVGLGQS